jgi:hypothetical protein
VTVTTAATPARPAQPKSLSFPALVAKARSGVIRIETTTCNGSYVGTGILISPTLVATVEHVVDSAATITLKENGKIVGYGTVIGSDPTRDVALVRTNTAIAGYHFRFASRAPALGESVSAIGFPLALPLTVTRGSVSGQDRTIPINGVNRTRLIQTDAPVNPGNSGGPLMTDSGLVVGLVDLGTTQANGLAFAVSAGVAGPLLQSWTAAPQPVANQSCSSAPASPVVTPAPAARSTSPTSLSYAGHDFTMDYPASWVISHLAMSQGFTDTTFQPQGAGGLLIRVDENPNGSTLTPQAAAEPVIAALEKDPSYIELGRTMETFNGVAALRWEFEVIEAGVEMHKVDEFFTDANGHGWGVLIQAPQPLWSQDAGALDTFVSTFQPA